jgi:hypothetical protein
LPPRADGRRRAWTCEGHIGLAGRGPRLRGQEAESRCEGDKKAMVRNVTLFTRTAFLPDPTGEAERTSIQ